MAQKPAYVNWTNRLNSKMLLEKYIRRHGVKRSTMFSVNNEEQLASESSRLRLTNMSKPESPPRCRDFAGYFKSSPNNADPNVVATSHMLSVPVAQRSSIIPTFPVQSLRWNPYLETSSFEDLDVEEELKSRCTCERCAAKNSTSWVSSSSTVKQSFYKNNIMTFRDVYTMTPRLTDRSCGYSDSECIPSTRESEVSTLDSKATITDGRPGINLIQLKCNPIPILKYNNRRQSQDLSDFVKYNGCYRDDYESSETAYETPEKDICSRDDNQKPTKLNTIKSYFKSSKNKNKMEPYRRVIYNEGISDSESNRVSSTPMRDPSAMRFNHCKASVRDIEIRRYNEREDAPIPHSYKFNSKYHSNCNRYESKIHTDDYDEGRYFIANPRLVTKTSFNQPTKYYQNPPIRLPKRVLTSKKEIGSFLQINQNAPRPNWKTNNN